MLSKDQRIELEKALSFAITLNKPFLRLCTDLSLIIEENIYKEIEKIALFSFNDAFFGLGEWEEKLKPLVTEYLNSKKFFYSLLDIDGLKKTRHVNASLWLTKENLIKNDICIFDDVLYFITEIIVGERLESLDKAKELSPEALAKIEIVTKGYNLGKPPLLKINYKYTAPNKKEYRKEMFTGVVYPYLSLPLGTWSFYNEKEAPLELLLLEKEIRKNPFLVR